MADILLVNVRRVESTVSSELTDSMIQGADEHLSTMNISWDVSHLED